MPDTAPLCVVPRQKMPSTMAGTNAAPAKEKEADTKYKMPAGRCAAT